MTRTVRLLKQLRSRIFDEAPVHQKEGLKELYREIERGALIDRQTRQILQLRAMELFTSDEPSVRHWAIALCVILAGRRDGIARNNLIQILHTETDPHNQLWAISGLYSLTKDRQVLSEEHWADLKPWNTQLSEQLLTARRLFLQDDMVLQSSRELDRVVESDIHFSLWVLLASGHDPRFPPFNMVPDEKLLKCDELIERFVYHPDQQVREFLFWNLWQRSYKDTGFFAAHVLEDASVKPSPGVRKWAYRAALESAENFTEAQEFIRDRLQSEASDEALLGLIFAIEDRSWTPHVKQEIMDLLSSSVPGPLRRTLLAVAARNRNIPEFSEHIWQLCGKCSVADYLLEPYDPDLEYALRLEIGAGPRVISPNMFNPTDQDIGKRMTDFDQRSRSPHFLLITALEIEYSAVVKLFPDGSDNQAGIFTCNMGSAKVSVKVLPEIGQLAAASYTAALIKDLDPTHVILVGICAGMDRELQYGDVVASDQIVFYEPAKIEGNENTPRWSVYRSSPELLASVKGWVDQTWATTIATPPATPQPNVPKCVPGLYMTGSKVIASKLEAGYLRSIWAKAAALEMEAAGVAEAVYSSKSSPHFITFKAICDFADESKADDWQPYAAESAAACAVTFLRTISSPGRLESTLQPPEPRQLTYEERSGLIEVLHSMEEDEIAGFCFAQFELLYKDLEGNSRKQRIQALINKFTIKRQLKDLSKKLGLVQDRELV